jgi:hypothetical protein
VIYYFFPAHREQPWLTRTGAIWLAVPTVAMNTLVFFTRSKERAPGQLPHFLLMLACVAFLVWLAAKAPRTSQFADVTCFRLKPIAWGMVSFLALLLVPVLLSKARIIPVLFYGYFAVAFALIVRWLTQRSTIPVMTCLLFAIGDDILMVVWAMPGALHRAGIQQLVADALMLVAFALLLTRLWKDSCTHHDTGHSCPASFTT